ncbi:MAG: hypothetical protein WBO98_03660, partial [Candidatus Nitrotoga sp.]
IILFTVTCNGDTTKNFRTHLHSSGKVQSTLPGNSQRLFRAVAVKSSKKTIEPLVNQRTLMPEMPNKIGRDLTMTTPMNTVED